MSNPPACLECGSPVKRHFGSYVPRHGHRIVNGKRWRWTCSRTCNGLYNGRSALKRGTTLNATRACQQKALRALVGRLVAAVKPHMDEHGKVEAMKFVDVFVREVRRERHRVNDVRYRRRQAAA